MVKQEKLKKVEMLRKDIEEHPVIALIDMHKMPSKQLQEIKKTLRGKAKIIMTKKSVLKFAIEGVKKTGIKELESHIPTQPAVALTETEAFRFYSFIDSLRFKTYAKDGDVAIEDIWVSAGPTHLMAGPVISEFQQAGVAASIEAGRIKIRKSVCIVKKGEEISAAKASILRKLKIEPMEVIMNVVVVYDNGDIYTKDTLELTKMFPQMVGQAFNNALNLSIFISFPTKQNIGHLLSKAVRVANAIKSVIGGDENVVDKTKDDVVGNKTEKTAGEDESPAEVKEVEDDKDSNDKVEEEHGGAS